MGKKRNTKWDVIGKTIKNKHGEITIKEYLGKGKVVSEFVAICSVCSIDDVMYPYGSLIYNMVNINRGDILCGCGKRPFQHLWQLELAIKRLIMGGDLKFSGWVGGHYKGSKSKMILKSENGEEWHTSFSNLQKQSTPIFSKKYKEQLKVKENLEHLRRSTLLPKHYTYSYDETSKEYQVSCSLCDSDPEFQTLGCKLYTSRLETLKVGRKPCRCSPTYKFSKEERMCQIKKQIEQRGGIKIVGLPKSLNSRSRVIWDCGKGHIQNSRLNDFVKGSGCFQCSKVNGVWYGYYSERSDEQDYLYLLKLTKGSEVFYKVGRSFNIKERIRKMSRDYEVILVSKVEGRHEEIYKMEQSLHKVLHKFQHYTKFYFEGCVCECFIPEILSHPEVISIFNLNKPLTNLLPTNTLTTS